ncbi:MAG: hypothetical protein IJT50_10320 [Lentisphaeria bacterium]|nr:hypothetical protein [Lentisphaeria bacterium]
MIRQKPENVHSMPINAVREAGHSFGIYFLSGRLLSDDPLRPTGDYHRRIAEAAFLFDQFFQKPRPDVFVLSDLREFPFDLLKHGREQQVVLQGSLHHIQSGEQSVGKTVPDDRYAEFIDTARNFQLRDRLLRPFHIGRGKVQPAESDHVMLHAGPLISLKTVPFVKTLHCAPFFTD